MRVDYEAALWGATICVQEMAWVKPKSLNAGDILTKWDGFRRGGISYALGLALGGKLRVSVGALDGTSRSLDSDPGMVPVGVWTHVAGTFNPVNQFLAIYINGLEVPGSLQPGSDMFSVFGDSETP